MKALKALTKHELLSFFALLDQDLKIQNRKIVCTVLGGAAIILLDFKERVTHDIDVPASQPDLDYLINFGHQHDIAVQAVSVCTTVDFEAGEKVTVYQGERLTVFSISPHDLIKSKLERFRKQDPDDINTVIKQINLSYAGFAGLFGEMLEYWVGNPVRLVMQARIVVEWNFPDHVAEFERTFPIG